MSESETENKPRKRQRRQPVVVQQKSSSGMFFWLACMAAIAVVLQFAGPYAGWFDRVFGSAPPPAAPANPAPAKEELVIDFTTSGGEDGLTNASASLAMDDDKSEFEKMFDALYEKALQSLTPAEIGKTYKVKLRSRTTVEGKLVAMKPGQIRLHVGYGTMTYPIHVIHPDSYRLMFPERTAKIQALKELKRQRRAQRNQQNAAPAEAPQQVEVADIPEETPDTTPEPRVKPRPRPRITSTDAGGPLYDPTPSPTPEHLKNSVQMFGQWLHVQHRRMGGRIATKVYAKQKGRKVILYVQMHRNFMVQDYDWRYQITEGMWRIWGLRSVDSGKTNEVGNAHVVLVDGSNTIIGGSAPEDGTEIWAEKKINIKVASK